MTDPYAWPDPPPPARGPRVLVYVALFALGFAGVLAVLFLRAPRGIDVPAPAGYVRLSDAEAGAGEMTASRTASHLGLARVDGFERGVLRAYGRPPGEAPKAVLVLVVEVADAPALRDAAVSAMRERGGTAFATPAGFSGWYDVPDRQGRHVQRVAWVRGVRLYVVSLLTPEREEDVREVVAIAEGQAG